MGEAAKGAAAAAFTVSMSYSKEVIKEVSPSVIKEVTSVIVKMDSRGALLAAFAAGVAAGSVMTLYTFHCLKRLESESATKRGLESTDETGNVVRSVDYSTGGSIIVKLSCYTQQSVLQFVKDLKENKIKRRLEEEFKKIGFDHELEVTIVCAKVVFQREYATR